MNAIDGRTQLVGLVGWPIAHSLSPQMQNAVFTSLGLNWRYVPFPVPPEQIAVALQGLSALGVRGVNITTPYKQLVLPFLDEIAPRARETGAVNTLLIQSGGQGKLTLYGDNTDMPGFVQALESIGFMVEENRQVMVIGAGGAARAVISGLLQMGIERVWVLNRDLEKSRTLISELGRHADWATRMQTRPLSPDALEEAAAAATLLVNATPVGRLPDAAASIWPDVLAFPCHLTVFDLVYPPQKTRLLQQAAAVGAQVITGIELLVQQGALSFELWTGEHLTPFHINLMRTVCQQGIAE